MKVRDSGMPEQTYWEGLFDIGGVMDGLQIDRKIDDAVEVGCGYGTFTLPVAQRIRGTLHAFDIEPEMVETTRRRVAAAGIENVRVEARDVIAAGFSVPEKSVDAVLLFNILHAEDPTRMLGAAADVVRPGGRVLVIHWRSDIKTPRGPDLSIRPKPQQIADWAASAGLQPQPGLLLPPWHFGIVLCR